jgi:hypothetical protein
MMMSTDGYRLEANDVPAIRLPMAGGVVAHCKAIWLVNIAHIPKVNN